MGSKTTESCLTESWKAMMLNVVTIEVCEEFLQPLIHDLMIGPSMIEFGKENGSPLPCFVSQRGKYICCQIVLDCLSVSLIQLSRPVVR